MRRVVIVSAGLTQPSSTRLLADRLSAALHALPGDLSLETIELREHAHSIVDAMLTGFPPPALEEVLKRVVTADALVAVTPVFTASYSGLFKSFFDVLDRGSLEGMPVLLAATAGSARHSLVLEHALRPLFSHLKAVTVPTAVFAAAEDRGTTSLLQERISRASRELFSLMSRERREIQDEFQDVAPFQDLLPRN